jgi:hypothetical protein
VSKPIKHGIPFLLADEKLPKLPRRYKQKPKWLCNLAVITNGTHEFLITENRMAYKILTRGDKTIGIDTEKPISP